MHVCMVHSDWEHTLAGTMGFEASASYDGLEEEVMCVWAGHKQVYGGGDGGILVWDATNQKEVRKITCFGDECVMSIVGSPKDSNLVFASAGTEIFWLDQRNTSEPLHSMEVNTDEINELTINQKGSLLAACDDNAEIKVVDVKGKSLSKTLRKRHSNIVNTVKFRKGYPYHLISGALDSSICYWDASKGSCFSVLNTMEAVEDNTTTTTTVNPPFVYSIACSGTGNMFAAGLGNGVVCCYNFGASHKDTITPVPLTDGHSSAVSQVLIPEFGEDKLIISGGNDKSICAWNLQLTEGRCISGENSARISHSSKINYLASDDACVYVVGQTATIESYKLR